MREATSFIFDGISSEDMGVLIASPDSGLFDEAFLPAREIVETRIPNRDKPYLQRVDVEPLSFPLTIYVEEWKERNNLSQIARWLYQPYYKPLIFNTNLDRVYYAIFDNDSRLIHNGAREGYITLNVRCSSPYSYSYPQKMPQIEVRGLSRTYIYNTGCVDTKPKMWIKKVSGAGNVTIKNLTTGQIVKLDNLQNNEEVFVDFENEEIVSSLEIVAVYRHDDHNGEWLNLVSNWNGENKIELTGDFNVNFEYELKYLMEWG